MQDISQGLAPPSQTEWARALENSGFKNIVLYTDKTNTCGLTDAWTKGFTAIEKETGAQVHGVACHGYFKFPDPRKSYYLN